MWPYERYHEPYWKYNGITSIARVRIRAAEKLETRWIFSRAESDSGNRPILRRCSTPEWIYC